MRAGRTEYQLHTLKRTQRNQPGRIPIFICFQPPPFVLSATLAAQSLLPKSSTVVAFHFVPSLTSTTSLCITFTSHINNTSHVPPNDKRSVSSSPRHHAPTQHLYEQILNSVPDRQAKQRPRTQSHAPHPTVIHNALHNPHHPPRSLLLRHRIQSKPLPTSTLPDRPRPHRRGLQLQLRLPDRDRHSSHGHAYWQQNGRLQRHYHLISPRWRPEALHLPSGTAIGGAITGPSTSSSRRGPLAGSGSGCRSGTCYGCTWTWPCSRHRHGHKLQHRIWYKCIGKQQSFQR